MNRLTETLSRLQSTKPWRAWSRYGVVRGNVLAGGVAYFAFFSLFPAMAIGFSVFGLILGGNAELKQHLIDYVNSAFGGTKVIGTTPGEGIVTIDQLDTLINPNALTTFGLVSVVVLLFTGLGWVGALRDGVSAVFGRRQNPNPVLSKLADLGVLAILGLSVLLSTVASVLVSSATGLVLGWLHLGQSQLATTSVTVLSSLVLLAIDVGLFLLLFHMLAGVRVALDDVFTGALLGAVALGLLKELGGVFLRMASGNRFLAAWSVPVGLLLWLNVAARLTLVASAWAATTATDRGHLAALATETTGTAEAGGAGEEPAGATPEGRPATGPGPAVVVPPARAADRVTLAAGAILGMTVAFGAHALGQAGRALWPGGGADRADDGAD